MRKGYLNTILRRLRDRLELGSNTFALGEKFLSVHSVMDAGEPCADAAGDMRFAEDSCGNWYVVNLNDGQVAFVDLATNQRSSLGADLRAFVDALEPSRMPWP